MSRTDCAPASSLPPGTALDSSDQTENPAKSATRNWRDHPPRHRPKKTTIKSSNDSSPSTATAIATATAAAASAHDDFRAHFPPDSEALGHATWTVPAYDGCVLPRATEPRTARAYAIAALRADTARTTSGSACTVASRSCIPARGSARRTMRSMCCSGSPHSIARASTSAGRMGRRMGAATE